MTTSTYSSDHHVIIDAVTHALRSLPEDSRIALGFSGGLDSTVLLDALVRVAGPTRCVALHIHHGLSPNADDWLAHCEARAREYGVSFEARHVNIARERDIGVEAAAREARYRALNEMCEQQRVTTLWLAQHADDQAETVLLQLLRGAGMAGLAAMAAEPMNPQDASQSCLSRMRPLLTVARVQLEQYAHEHALRWVEDESNADTQYLRNALRHDIIPKLAAHFPAYRTALARTAKHAANAQQLLNELAELDMRSISRGVRLSRTALLALDDVRALNVMRFWMRQLNLPFASTRRLTDALRQLRDAEDAHQLRVDHAGHCLRLYRDDIYWEPRATGVTHVGHVTGAIESEDNRALSELIWRGQEVWYLRAWQGTVIFAPAAPGEQDAVAETLLTTATLSARLRIGGERMHLLSCQGSRTLKNLFQEQGIPAWERNVPLIYLGEQLLFVPGIGINHALLPSTHLDEPYRRIEWRADVLIA